ncbi:hypothetical protein RintRC_3222 [Richelia intracellularis]|nr:hypothetical protein RintRC_3222 [Richelia intracellularis]
MSWWFAQRVTAARVKISSLGLSCSLLFIPHSVFFSEKRLDTYPTKIDNYKSAD